MRLDEAHFTVFDFETTGLYPYSGDRICEVGAIRTGPDGGEKIFHSLIDPGIPISAGAFAVNRITPAMLRGKPTISEVLPDFLRFIEGSALVAYNAGFDLGFLLCALGKDSDILELYDVVDALALARRLFPDMPRYNLATVASSLGIETRGEHRAMADTMMTLGIFRKELEALAAQGATEVADIATTRSARPASVQQPWAEMLNLFEGAIRAKKRLAITYRSPWSNYSTKRVITPLQIRKGHNNFYIVAHCHLRNEERNFRLDGVVEAGLHEGSSG
jgi:DNA polymerase-3 subunit epsilon